MYRPDTFQFGTTTDRMAFRTTLGWSLISSGIVTLLLGVLPGGDLMWGLLLLVVGVATLLYRQT